MKTSSMLAALAALSLAGPASAQPYPYAYPPGYPAYPTYPAYPPGYPPQGYPPPPGYPAYPQAAPYGGPTYPDDSQPPPDDSQDDSGYPQSYPGQPRDESGGAQAYPGEGPDSAAAAPGNIPNGQSLDSDTDSIAELLAAHNQYRAALGLAPLHWSSILAAKAQRWADHLAATGQLEHNGSGQNLAMASAGSESLSQLVQLWGDEQGNFTDGVFPDISTTGNWMDVGHYSQMVWSDTTALGCGFAEADGRDVLVCDYDPPGNVTGERPY